MINKDALILLILMESWQMPVEVREPADGGHVRSLRHGAAWPESTLGSLRSDHQHSPHQVLVVAGSLAGDALSPGVVRLGLLLHGWLPLPSLPGGQFLRGKRSVRTLQAVGGGGSTLSVRPPHPGVSRGSGALGPTSIFSSSHRETRFRFWPLVLWKDQNTPIIP